MLTVATLFWQANRHSRDFSAMYSEAWVEKLYRGFARNLTRPFRFVCYTDRPRRFTEPIEQRRIRDAEPSYASCIQPYELTAEGPMILVGLDTVVVANIDHLAASCATRADLGLPRDPYHPSLACNGVALVPAGMERVAAEHRGENDMVHVRAYPHSYLDDEFPGQVVSWKGHVDRRGAAGAKVIYFHGQRKPHQLAHKPLIKSHWR